MGMFGSEAAGELDIASRVKLFSQQISERLKDDNCLSEFAAQLPEMLRASAQVAWGDLWVERLLSFNDSALIVDFPLNGHFHPKLFRKWCNDVALQPVIRSGGIPPYFTAVFPVESAAQDIRINASEDLLEVFKYKLLDLICSFPEGFLFNTTGDPYQSCPALRGSGLNAG